MSLDWGRDRARILDFGDGVVEMGEAVTGPSPPHAGMGSGMRQRKAIPDGSAKEWRVNRAQVRP